MFEGGELKLVLLHLMEAQQRHGYELIREIELRSGGTYTPSPGIVYPTLTMLEELDHISAVEAEGAKRAFVLTEAGRAYLDEHRKAAEAAMARLDAMRQESAPTDSGPVRRAMQNLKSVLEQRLDGTAEKELLFAAAELIDEAARRIERLP
jgi:DNA-binding PadR family transcriptional regulator